MYSYKGEFPASSWFTSNIVSAAKTFAVNGSIGMGDTGNCYSPLLVPAPSPCGQAQLSVALCCPGAGLYRLNDS